MVSHLSCVVSHSLLTTRHPEVATPTLVGGNDDLRPLLFSSMLRPGSLDGHLYVLEIDQQVVSVALWFSPGHGVWKTLVIFALSATFELNN